MKDAHDMTAAVGDAADTPMPVIDRRLKEQLLILMLLDCLRCDDDDDAKGDDDHHLHNISLNDMQVDVSKQIMTIAQRMCDNIMPNLCLREKDDAKPSSSDHLVPSEQQLVDDKEAAEGDTTASTVVVTKSRASGKKKRYRKNKAAAKRRKKIGRMSWLHGVGILPQIIMMALGSITTLIVCLTIIHQRVDGSSEGGASPALQPTSSKPLLRRKTQHNQHPSDSAVASTLSAPGIINPSTISRTVSSHRRTQEPCFDTPNWKDKNNSGCDWYGVGVWVERGCPEDEWYTGDMGPASENCCHCGGGARTCKDYRSMCQKHLSVAGEKDVNVIRSCEAAEYCVCGTDHNYAFDYTKTVGLHDDCKCDYWLRLCEDTGEGVACDYAAEYCCGDYGIYPELYVALNSPVCYCDFFNYARNKFDHTLKHAHGKLFIEFSFCEQFEKMWLDDDNYEEELNSLQAIYEQTNGRNWIDNSGWMNDTVPHCQWYGISCNDDKMVIGIDLRNNNLQGEFPVYTRSTDLCDNPIPESNDWLHSKYGLANLYHLETLDLADNDLTGTVEYRPLYNLKSLHTFDISGNQLSGGFDPLISPSISYANFSNNRFTSMYHFRPYKVSPLQAMRSLDVSNNEIKMNTTDLFNNIPQDIEQFIASNNDIHGKLPASLNNLPMLRRFDMSSNALSGELPVFENSWFVLQELDLSNQHQANGFTGSIPEELWQFRSLKIMILAGNKLTGALSPDIVNLAAVERLDLSSNLFSGEIPPQVGQLSGTLNYLGLANNKFFGKIPSELGELKDASVHLRDNLFYASPLSLCTVGMKYFDLKDNHTLCPIERTSLSMFYDSAKGAEWANASDWTSEYTSHCYWHGVECDKDNQVTELDLRNNGLSGRLSPSIGNLTSLTKLDLSDNDIKGSIPTEIGKLTQLTYLRLSYNAFTGEAPEELVDLINLQLLQLQSNRITNTTFISQLEVDKKSIYGNSRFVADCGVPSAFEEALRCEICPMCCNENGECYPPAPAVDFVVFLYGAISILSFCAYFPFLYFLCRSNSKTKNHEENRKHLDVVGTIGKNSVYQYFVTGDNLRFGWIIAFAILGIQAFILYRMGHVSDEIFWECPRDSDICTHIYDSSPDEFDLGPLEWFVFAMLMLIFLGKDIFNGYKLIYHSGRNGYHSIFTLAGAGCLIGGLSLWAITLYALFVSIVYNSRVATSASSLFINSVAVLFVMEVDEKCFSLLEAINEKWTKSGDGDGNGEEEGKKKTGVLLNANTIATHQDFVTD